MPKIKSNSALKSILVLAAIALCSGLLLGLFRIITYVDPLTSTYQKFAEDTGASFSQMADEEGAAYGDGAVVYYAVSDDGQWHAFLAEGKGGYGGSVQVYVYIRGGVLEKLVLFPRPLLPRFAFSSSPTTAFLLRKSRRKRKGAGCSCLWQHQGHPPIGLPFAPGARKSSQC